MQIKIKKVTLLSTEDYEQHKAAISKLGFNFWWWLRSPGYYSCFYGDYVCTYDGAVVLALLI